MLLPVSHLTRFGKDRAFIEAGTIHRLATFGLVERSLCRKVQRQGHKIIEGATVTCVGCRRAEKIGAVEVIESNGEIRHRGSIKLRDKETGRRIPGCFAS